MQLSKKEEQFFLTTQFLRSLPSLNFYDIKHAHTFN